VMTDARGKFDRHQIGGGPGPGLGPLALSVSAAVAIAAVPGLTETITQPNFVSVFRSHACEFVGRWSHAGLSQVPIEVPVAEQPILLSNSSGRGAS
jgi:hypothetical protein